MPVSHYNKMAGMVTSQDGNNWIDSARVRRWYVTNRVNEATDKVITEIIAEFGKNDYVVMAVYSDWLTGAAAFETMQTSMNDGEPCNVKFPLEV